MPTEDAQPEQGEAGVRIPVLELSGVGLQYGQHPVIPGLRSIIIGPVLLLLPLDDENVTQVIQGLTGVIVPAATMPPRVG